MVFDAVHFSLNGSIGSSMHPSIHYMLKMSFSQRLPRGQIPRADPATINPLEKLTLLHLLLLGFHFRFLQIIKSPGPMEQFATFLFGFHLRLYQLHKL